MRSGRHTQPSQVEKVAEKAGKAAPVMAISAGALVAVPHGHAVAPAKHGTVAEAVTTAKTQSESGVSAVQAIAIAKVAHANATSLNAMTTSYQAKHAKPVQNSASQAHVAHLAHVTHLAHVARERQAANAAHEAHLSHLNHVAHQHQSAGEARAAHLAHLAHLNHLNRSAGQTSSSSSSSSSSSHSSSSSTVSEVSHSAPVTSHGIYSCSALESLWEEAGGSSGTAFMAAEIATAESGGNPNAESPTDDFGLWQINGSHGSMATLDPLGNARAAVSISNGGSSWGAWTTYTSGAYSGRC
ncbi:MAG TPA: transglycosylase SLT domain-containing protein [Streptosporangiaceae bacterium]